MSLSRDNVSRNTRISSDFVMQFLPPSVKKPQTETRMWASAQRDGRPAEYRWRPPLKAAKFGWRPLLECRAVRLPRREIRWNLLGCPKLANRSQPLVGRNSPNSEDIWKRYCCLTSFFLNIYTWHSCKDKIQPDKDVWWCPDGDFWRFFGSCTSSEPRATHFRLPF